MDRLHTPSLLFIAHDTGEGHDMNFTLILSSVLANMGLQTTTYKGRPSYEFHTDPPLAAEYRKPLSVWQKQLVGRKVVPDYASAYSTLDPSILSYLRAQRLPDEVIAVIARYTCIVKGSNELPTQPLYIRIVGFEYMMTCDFVEDRLNVHLDERDVVRSVDFG